MKKIGKKGVINVLELIVVTITLFISFSIFFPRADYKNRWEDAYIILKARDMLLLFERTGNLHTYAFKPQLMVSFFEALFPESTLMIWSETEGSVKSDIKIACDCPSEIIADLTSWTKGLKLNERDIEISFCSLNLDFPEPCLSDSDAMLIWGQKPLQTYEQLLLDYISDSRGIVEVMDFEEQSKVDGDSVQRNIFGLKWFGIETGTMNYDEFSREPRSTEDIVFNPYKYFYHIPLPLETTDVGDTIDGCVYDPPKNGTLVFRGTNYDFWICSESSVWFDTNGDGDYDILVNERDEVPIGGYNFLLSYVNSDSSISISFKPTYRFDDFLKYANSPGQIFHVSPIDGNANRILIRAVIGTSEYPSVIINQFKETGVAWLADFSEDEFGDDEKLLLTTLLLWASNKRETSSEVANLQFGYLTTYVNVKNIDMFEVYKFSLGLGYPF